MFNFSDKTNNSEALRTPFDPNSSTTPVLNSLGRFAIRRMLGEGAFGRVYEADDPLLRRRVALKVAKIEQRDGVEMIARFQREARAAANLMHPHIVAIYDSGEESGQHYIAYAFVEGKPLSAAIQSGKPFPFTQAVYLVRKMAEALAYAHRQGVIHRDVKPDNVMVREDGEPMLMDFGLAVIRQENRTLTRTGEFMGTPQYAAPEQWRGQASPASDQYSLGILFYELLAGCRPFDGAWIEFYRLLHTEQIPASPRTLRPDLPRDLETIVLKCLEKEEARRYPNCQALADDLRRWQEGQPVTARRPGVAERLARWARRNPVVAALSVAVMLTLILGTVVSVILARDAAHQAETARQAEAEARWQKERAQQQAVEARKDYDLAFDSLNQMVFNLQEHLSKRPGTLTLRKEILMIAQERIKKLADRAKIYESGPINNLHIIHLRLGSIASSIGDTVGALSESRIALDLLQSHLQRDPENVRYRRHLSMTYTQIAQLEIIASRHDVALDLVRRALTIQQQLVEQYPDDNDYRVKLIGIHRIEADALLIKGLAYEALTVCDRAITILQQLIQEDAHNSQYLYDLTGLFFVQGNGLLQLNQPLKAYQVFNNALDLLERLIQSDRNDFRYRSNQMQIRVKIAEQLVKESQFFQALKEYQAALTTARQLVDAEPDNRLYQFQLANLYGLIGLVFYHQGNQVEALEAHNQSVILFESLASQPNNWQSAALENLLLTYRLVGKRLRTMGRFADALIIFRKSLKLSQQFAEAATDNLKEQYNLFIDFWELARTELASHDYIAAIESFTRAQAVLHPLVVNKKLPASFGKSLEVVQFHLGYCRAAAKAVAHLNGVYREGDEKIGPLFIVRVKALLNRQRYDDAIKTAECYRDWAESCSPHSIMDQRYDAACALALCAAADPSRRDILVAKSAAVLSKLEASNYFKDVVKLAYFFRDADFDGIREHPAFMRLVDTLPKPSTMPILSPHIQFIDTLPKLPLLPIRAPLAPG